MLPNAEQNDQGNPPCRPRPHEQRDAVDEGAHRDEKRHVAVGEDEHRTGIGGDRGCAHHHPQQGRYVLRLDVKEKDAVCEQCYEDAVESEPDAPEHVDQDEDTLFMAAKLRRDGGPENNQRFRADDGDQPPSMHDIGVPRRVEKGENAERQIDEQQPKPERERPHPHGGAVPSAKMQANPQYVRRRHDGEERKHEPWIGKVGPHARAEP